MGIAFAQKQSAKQTTEIKFAELIFNCKHQVWSKIHFASEPARWLNKVKNTNKRYRLLYRLLKELVGDCQRSGILIHYVKTNYNKAVCNKNIEGNKSVISDQRISAICSVPMDEDFKFFHDFVEGQCNMLINSCYGYF